MSDQAALPNLNANWVNAKGEFGPRLLARNQKKNDTDIEPFQILGAWTIHFVLIAALKIFYDIIPGVSQETSWTLTNITYMFVTFIMFHWVRGIPFEFNAGAYDNLNMWEQIDNGDQYTPAKKFLLSVPIILFLLSTHYTHYDLTSFLINFMATLGVVIPKLPIVSEYPSGSVCTSSNANPLIVSSYADRSFFRNAGRLLALFILTILSFCVKCQESSFSPPADYLHFHLYIASSLLLLLLQPSTSSCLAILIQLSSKDVLLTQDMEFNRAVPFWWGA